MTPALDWYKLCGKWDFPVLSRPPKASTGGFAENYLDRLQRRLSDPSREAVCTEALYRFLAEQDPEIHTVAEYCAGIGLNGFCIERILKPQDHRVHDINEECVQQLGISVPEARASISDFFKSDKHDADLAVLDFNSYTVLSGSKNPDMMRALSDTLGKTRKWATITDGCTRYFHTNRESYAKVLGVEVIHTFEDYVQAASLWYQKKFGFSVVHVEYNSGASWMLLKKGVGHPLGRVTKTTAPYRGLVKMASLDKESDSLTMFEVAPNGS